MVLKSSFSHIFVNCVFIKLLTSSICVKPIWEEWFIFFWMVNFMVEKIRGFSTQTEGRTWLDVFKVSLSDLQNRQEIIERQFWYSCTKLTVTGLSWSLVASRFSRARNKHPLVLNFRLTKIDMISIFLVIVKIRIENKL